MYIVTAKEMYDVDHYTMQEIGVDGKILMENAGRAISEKVVGMIGKQDRIAVLAGPGNNGGDVFVIARTLWNQGYDICVIQVVADEKVTGDALYHKLLFQRSGGSIFIAIDGRKYAELIQAKEVIIDAMLGIGVSGKLRSPLDEFVSILNSSNKTIISVDIPSGLPAGEGSEEFTATGADYTFVVGAPKISAFLTSTAPFYGKWEQVDIGFPFTAFQKFTNKTVWTEEQLKETLPKRTPFSHKGDHGRGLIIGGNDQMPGSILMSTKAALKAGSGLITAGTTGHVIQMIAAQCAEAMYLELPDSGGYVTNEKKVSLENYHGIAVGIGMGRNKEAEALVRSIIEMADSPIIIDADGLYHMKSSLTAIKKRTKPTIITPHPGEMAMLLDISIGELLLAPFRYSKEFAKNHGVYVVLKGKYTIITAPDGKQAVNYTGNPGLAKGGSGDVLTGMTLAMVMQKQTLFQALCNACFIHGKSADLQVDQEHSYYDLLATDVIEGIPLVYRTYF